MEVILNNNLTSIFGEYFQQMFGIIMETHVAPILANICMAKLENLVREKCKTDQKFICPMLFETFIYDGFGIIKGNKSDLNVGFPNFAYKGMLSQSINSNMETL